MTSATRKEYVLEGLDCANCAAKIEERVKKLGGVKTASLNFATKTLTIDAESGDTLDGIAADAGRIIKSLEPDVVVTEAGWGAAGNNNGEPARESGVISRTKLLLTGAGAALFIFALLVGLPFWIRFGVFLVSYLLVGGEILLKAGRNILKGQVFDENFLMSVATIGAFAIREFPEGVAVMLFYQIGIFFEELAVSRSRRSIAALMDIRPDYANIKNGGDVRRVRPDAVRAGDIIIVKAGEKVPLDGKIIEGRSTLDMSALTGESLPREAAAGDGILSGSINGSGLLTVEVTKPFGESTVAKILDLVQNAASKKAPTENFITKFAKFYTPAVVFAAAAIAVIPPLLIHGATFAEWVGRALVFLVVSCPCALVISIPLGFFGGIGNASRNGILIKGSNYLEALNNVDTAVFDKTGTLSKGVFAVTRLNSAGETAEDALLEYAAYAESYSNHPIARSILKAYGKEIDTDDISDVEEISGFGVKVTAKGRRLLAGNARLMASENIAFEESPATGTVVYIAADGKYAGSIVISDELKPDSKHAIGSLRQLGVTRLVMLTGDSGAVGEEIGKSLGLDEVYAELLPDQKVAQLEKLEARETRRGKLIFVGDGINDAPVLARADVGVAMGGLGSDAAIEAADVVLMTDEPSKLVTAIKIAKRTRTVVWQNIIFAMAVKVIVLAMGAGGIATIWEAVFADVGVTVLAVLNAIRGMNAKIK